jgi:hypothetical protein
MNVINVENDYRNGVVVQLNKDDICQLKFQIGVIQGPYRDIAKTAINLVEWIIRELEN